MSETTKKEQEFVIKTLEMVREYENADFNLIESLSAIFKMVYFAKHEGITISEVIKDNKEEWGID